MDMNQFRKAKKSVTVTVGESVCIIRELQELSQTDLAKRTGIPQSTISAIENNRINLGVERAKVVARALLVHHSVLVFPGWNVQQESRQHNTRILRVGHAGSGSAHEGREVDRLME